MAAALKPANAVHVFNAVLIGRLTKPVANSKSFRQNVEYNSYDKWGFSTVGRFNKYIFTSDISGKVNEVGDEKVLIISDREINTKKLPNTVNLLNNKPSLFIYE